jgi:PLP dependent protein
MSDQSPDRGAAAAQPAANDARIHEVESNLKDVQAAIALAARDAGRSAGAVTLIGITKTWPIEDVRTVVDLGVRDVGENKAQELASKAVALAGEYSSQQLRWHFVGALQRNKAKAVAEHAAMVHSVDRVALVDALEKASAELEREPLPCLVQVNLDPEPVPGRAGVAPSQALEIAERIADAPHLELAGVMGVAPRGGNAAEAFDLLARTGSEIAARYPQATAISAGMSGDFATAIAAGATHVRLGAVLLGQRRTSEVTSEAGGGFPPRPVQCTSRE